MDTFAVLVVALLVALMMFYVATIALVAVTRDNSTVAKKALDVLDRTTQKLNRFGETDE